jgi:hypothetical protein
LGSQQLKVAVHKGHGHGSFANCGRHPFDRLAADVAGREHPRSAGLQKVGLPFEGPLGRELPFDKQIRAGEDKPVVVSQDLFP